MLMIVKQMRSALHRGTDLGNEMASLAMQTQVSRVSEYITVRKDTRAGLKRRQPATPDKASAEDSDEPVTEESKSRKKRLKFKDVEGVKGPGGQVRMKGGNPKGKLCAAFAKGKCNFSTCPFLARQEGAVERRASAGPGGGRQGSAGREKAAVRAHRGPAPRGSAAPPPVLCYDCMPLVVLGSGEPRPRAH